MIDILYEDKQIIVCIKPPGMLSASGKEETSVDMVLQKHREEAGEAGFIGVAHRLDRGTGGLMVFAKTQAAAAALSREIQSGMFQKEYLAVVHGVPDNPAGIYTDLLFKDAKKNKSFVVQRERKGVRKASLEYKVLETAETRHGVVSLIRIRLQTGRTHQIRVQFSSRKMPLLGDGKYGSKDNGCQIALWSCRLAFAHPKNQKKIDMEASPKAEYPWNLFSCLNL